LAIAHFWRQSRPAWLIAALCLGLCAAAIALWQTDLSIRQRLHAMGYNEILALRDDAWRPFRVPLTWAFTVMSVCAAAASCLPGILVRRRIVWLPATIAAIASVAALG
jgi:hypothetical protein